MPFSARAVANYILDLASASSVEVTPMKLQKLVYFSHGWHLAVTAQPLINEPVEAWKFGPVIPSIYHDFKHFGNAPITERARAWDFVGKKLIAVTPGIDPAHTDAQTAIEVIQRTWQEYSKFSAIQLSNMTHQPGTPWEQVWKNDKREHVDIDDRIIAKYFRELVHSPQAR